MVLCSDQNQVGLANNIMCERLFQITLVFKVNNYLNKCLCSHLLGITILR
jgi:hypothetical protein